MTLDEITQDRKVIGTLVDNITDERYEILIKQGGSFSGDHTEYKIDIEKDGERQGYLKFVPDLYGGSEYVLSALQTHDNARGKNLSDALLEVLFQFAELNETKFTSSVKQRKPLTAFILQKYGFKPCESRPRDEVEILGRYAESSLLIAFKDETKRREFEASNLCSTSQQYKVVSSNPELIEDTITLLSPYLLDNMEKCEQRREYTQNRFSIAFQS